MGSGGRDEYLPWPVLAAAGRYARRSKDEKLAIDASDWMLKELEPRIIVDNAQTCFVPKIWVVSCALGR